MFCWKSNGRVRGLFDGGAGGLSRSSGSCIEKLIASVRKPSTPRSSHKRTAPRRASCPSGMGPLSCGCDPRKLCRRYSSEEGRDGKECVSQCRYGWLQDTLKKKKYK